MAPLTPDQQLLADELAQLRTQLRSALQRLAAQQAITHILAQSGTVSQATPRIIEAICTSTGWDIGALWEVSDASTPQLMDALYRELSKGKDPATALRDAKLTLLHSSDPDSVFRKPFYWAPFQLYAGS